MKQDHFFGIIFSKWDFKSVGVYPELDGKQKGEGQEDGTGLV